MNAKGDANRSVRNTKARIRRAFLELMQEKQYTKISVQELSEKAEINRATFYLHYKDVYDLIDQIENEFMLQVSEALKHIGREQYVPGQHPQHTAVFKVMNQNLDLCSILMSKNGDIGFYHKLMEAMYNSIYTKWKDACRGHVPENLDMYASYIVCGMLGIYTSNLKAGGGKSTEDMGYFAGEVTNWIDDVFVLHHNYLNTEPEAFHPELQEDTAKNGRQLRHMNNI